MSPRARLAAAVLLLAAGTLAATWPTSGAAVEKSGEALKRASSRPASVAARGGRAAGRDSVLARIGREVITRREVQRRIDGLPEPHRTNYGTVDGRRQFLDRLIEERVWLLGARKRGVAARPEVRQQIEQSERELLIRTYVNEVMAANPAPSDSEAHATYNAHAADYRLAATVTISHILLKTESEARRIRQWAKGGQDWKKLAARFSADSLTRANGGALGTVTREGIFGAIGSQPALAESAFALATGSGPDAGVGAIGGPCKTARGWHVIRIDAEKPESTRPFEQVRTVILRQMVQSRNQDYYRQRLTAEKASLGFSVDSAAVAKFVSPKKTPQELFREGQEAGAPTVRIAAYRRLVQDYPDSEVSPQAQFMIGFIYSEELKSYEEADQAFRELLKRYPNAELADSARWMIEHMRTEGAPPFMNLEADSSARVAPPGDARRPSGKP
ncbi:MAG: peptidyl-prolyl cis-trans isomerase [Candidatus Eisenbacteria bacterium]